MKHSPRNIVIDWLNTIWSTDLPSNAKLVACNLRRYMNSQNDMAWPSVPRIAGECGLSEQCVRKHLRLLCTEGWLQQTGKSNLDTYVYQAQTPPAMVAPLQSFTQTPAMVAPELNNELNNPLSKGSRFVKPTIDDIKIYCAEKGYTFDAEIFINHYNSNGWKVGRNSMKCWKSACATWNKREKTNGQNRQASRGNSQGPEVISAADLLNEGNVITG
jgi:hypothetical protein